MSNSSESIETVREWEHRGHECMVKTHPLGHYMGYVKLANGAPSSDEYNFVYDLRVHGGITHEADADGVIGFDCAHSGDVCLDENGERWGTASEYPLTVPEEDRLIWTIEDVVDETELLVMQVISHDDEYRK